MLNKVKHLAQELKVSFALLTLLLSISQILLYTQNDQTRVFTIRIS